MTGSGRSENADLSFESFASSRSPRLLRLAARLLADRHLAEDAVQDVLAKVFVRWQRISAMDNADAFVTTILVHHCTRWWRTALRRPLQFTADNDHWDVGGTPDPGESTADRDLIWRSLATLSPRQRQVLVLRHYEDLPDVEIARILGMSESTVRNHAHHGSIRLRFLLDPRPETDHDDT